MRCLVVADLHYSLPQFDWLLSAAPQFDLVIFAGDALDLGSAVDFRAQIVVDVLGDPGAFFLQSSLLLEQAEPVMQSAKGDITHDYNYADGESAENEEAKPPRLPIKRHYLEF